MVPELRRPGQQARATTYQPWTSYGATVLPGTKPIVLYLRLSKVHRIGDAADSIERQRQDLIRKLSTDVRFTVVGEFVDNDSASLSAARVRKGWSALNEAIESGEVRAVAFWKLDRTNRVAARILDWLARCRELDVALLSHEDSEEHLGRITGDAKLLIGVKALLAEVETDTMSTRQLAAKRHAAEAGFNHGGSTPFGWRIGAKGRDSMGRTGSRLEPHPVEFPALQDGVRLVLEYASLATVARHWRDNYGIVTATGGLIFVANVRRYLSSPRLMGYRMRQVPEHQRGVKLNLMDYIARDVQGEPVISQEAVCDPLTWRRLQNAISMGHTGPRSDWGTHPWLLTKVLFCPCGNPLYGRVKKWGDHRELQYSCAANRRRGPGTCARGVSILTLPAEAFVFGWLVEFLSPDRLRQAEERAAANETSPVGTLLGQLEELKAERDGLIAQQGTGVFVGAGVSILLGMLGNVAVRIAAKQNQIDAMTPNSPLPTGDELERTWPDIGLEQRRALVRRVIRRIEVKPGRGSAAERLTIEPQT